jgi:2-polyprenyl-3-methyl-5-hydroxy-6-metoxy-1,4-benzoquinol methylase
MKYQYTAYYTGCPICGNTENKLLYSVDAKQAARHFTVTNGSNNITLDIVEEKIAKLWNKNTASIISCTNCNFAFADPFIAGDGEFYNLLPHSTGDDDSHWKWEFEKTLNSLAPIAAKDPDLHLLEIGASTGGFIKRVAKLLKKKNILCLEYSETGVNKIRQADIEAHSWNFRDLGSDKKFFHKFNVICLFQVLEHMDNLDSVFNTFNLIIKPGGQLFIGVPNGEKIKFNELNNALLDMPPNHIGRFNKKTFEFLANKFGWDVIDIAIEPFTSLDVMKTVMYYQSLQRAQQPAISETIWYRMQRYIGIKYLRLKAIFMHKKLGETLWVQLCKKG